ncbi:hypothetical protein [Nocardioides terrisoli]|uniref:hypothetical protein n=1 Tax=Nocardioides terrisoli TaxID=3388267 RepID=UPI00287B7FB9|nr:hypothetical protein [Nocardioides marmorisolisilvae]
MAKTQFNVEQIKTEAVKPFFAVAGATELAVDVARGYATEAQKTYQKRVDAVQARVSKVEYRDAKALQGQAREVVTARVEELSKEAREAQARFEARIAELRDEAKGFPARVQAQVDEAVADLTETYADLAKRGEKFVAALRKDGVKALTAVKKAPSRSTTVRREKAVSAAKSAPAKKATAKKAPAKKAPAKSTAKKAAPKSA